MTLFAVGTLLLVTFSTAPAGNADPPGLNVDPPCLEKVLKIQDQHTKELMDIPGVVGTATGLDALGEYAVHVYTSQNAVQGIPRKLKGVRVVVKMTGNIFALKGPPGGGGGGNNGGDEVDPTARLPRPVPIGVSTGYPSITAGTIGCRVTDGTNVYALSNNHVYAATNAASIGDAVIQPGTYDGGLSPADDIGTLADFEPILFDGSDNVIGGAIALSSIEDSG